MVCEVPMCGKPDCEPSGLCRVHIMDLSEDDPRLGPLLTFFLKPQEGGPGPGGLRKFSMYTDKYGDDQVREVWEGVQRPVVYVEGAVPSRRS
jgi:hypothetical protein